MFSRASGVRKRRARRTKIGVLGIGLCFGLILLALCYAIGGISGCRVNPAVSLGVFLTDRNFKLADLSADTWWRSWPGLPPEALFFLWLMSAGGYFNGGPFAFGGITEGIGFTDKVSYLATNVCQPGVSQGFALLTESLLTFLFVFVVLGSYIQIREFVACRSGDRSDAGTGEYSGYTG